VVPWLVIAIGASARSRTCTQADVIACRVVSGRPRFNIGSFAVGSFGTTALGGLVIDHFHWQLDVRLRLVIGLIAGLLLAFEVPPREKRRPEPPVGPPPVAR
jgi:predicted MFS family arabinose efflux permease